MTARPRRMTAAHVEEPNDLDLARLDDDAAARQLIALRVCAIASGHR